MSEFDQTIVDVGKPIPADTPQKPCLTVLYGGPVGLVYTLPVGSETLIGRGDESDLPLGESRVSRKHAVIRVNQDRTVVIEDQGSSNGTFVNGTKVDKHQLEDGDRVQIGYSCIIKFSYQDDLEYQLQHEIAGGIKDPLTGLYTKMYFDDRLASEFTHACRRKDNLGVLLFAIDHFDKVNLCHGQSAGDLVVKEVAREHGYEAVAKPLAERRGGKHDLPAWLEQRAHRLVHGHLLPVDAFRDHDPIVHVRHGRGGRDRTSRTALPPAR